MTKPSEWVVEENVWDDIDCDRSPQRRVRFVRIHDGKRRGEKRYEVFVDTGEILASRIVPEGEICANYLKEALVDTFAAGFGPVPSDLQIGCMDGRIRTRMEYEYEDKKTRVEQTT